jgi:hypothetical protein
MPLCPLIPAVLGLPLAACAAPADLSLPTKPDLADSVVDLQRDGIDLTSSPTVSQIAVLAVCDNPVLQRIRARHGVAQAPSFVPPVVGRS